MALRVPRAPHALRASQPHQQQRTFSTSSACRRVQKTNARHLIPADAPPPPLYPYGRSRFYKQRDTGLYGGVTVQFGNNVGPKSEVKSRRRWTPNIVHKRLWSAALERLVTLKVATRVLRTIDKVGGLDNYLLGRTPARVKELGEEGWRLRWAVLQAPSTQRRLRTDPSLGYLARQMRQIETVRRPSVEDADVVAAQTFDASAPPVELSPEEEADRRYVEEETDERAFGEGEERTLAEPRATDLHAEDEARVRRNLQSDFMREEPRAQPTLWQRVTRPFRR